MERDPRMGPAGGRGPPGAAAPGTGGGGGGGGAPPSPPPPPIILPERSYMPGAGIGAAGCLPRIRFRLSWNLCPILARET